MYFHRGLKGGVNSMTPIQETLFDIVDDISNNHNTFEGLMDDRFYQKWTQHVSDKKSLERKMKRKYKEQSMARQLELEGIPRYF